MQVDALVTKVNGVPKQNDCSDNKVKVGLHFGNYFQKELSFLSFVKDEIQCCNFYTD